MTQQTNADDSIDIEHNGETLTVPTTFTHGDLPDEIRVDRIFAYDGVVRAEQQGEPWVVVSYFTADDVRYFTESGWLAQEVDLDAATVADEEPGETLWMRDD